jgi:hypothetical protein
MKDIVETGLANGGRIWMLTPEGAAGCFSGVGWNLVGLSWGDATLLRSFYISFLGLFCICVGIVYCTIHANT